MALDNDIELQFAAAVRLALTALPARAIAATLGAGVNVVAAGAARAVCHGPAPAASKIRMPPRTVLVASPDHSVCWAFQPSGIVCRSTDRKSWIRQATGGTQDLLAGAATSSTVCWAVGRLGTILLTTDGAHWTQVPSPTTVDLVGVIAASGEAAMIVAKDRRSYHTFDSGKSWQPNAGAPQVGRRLGNGRRLIVLGERVGFRCNVD